MRFGVREIANVVLRARSTIQLGNRKFYKNEPVIYFDSLKTSSLEGASTTVYATGGRGNARLVAWDGERTLTFTMEDALISPESFSILSGAGLVDATEAEPIYVHTTYDYEVKEPNTIVLPEAACWNKYDKNDPDFHNGADIFVMVLKNGKIEGEPCVPYAVADDHKTITCYSHAGQIDVGDVVKVDFYVKRTSNAQMMEISVDQFGNNFYLEAQTLFRDEDTGVDMPAEFIIPNCKIQSNFTFSMAATGDPSTFTFTLDAFPDYTKFKKTKKVLAALQVITDDVDSANDTRVACVPQIVESVTDGVSVTFDDDSTEDNCKLTVIGNNVNGTTYSKELWGNLPQGKNLAAIQVVMPVEDRGTYRLVSTNPIHQFFKTDPSIENKNGTWIKDKTYEIVDGGLTTYVALGDDKSTVTLQLFDDANELIKTFVIKNKVNFTKAYEVREMISDDATVTITERRLNGETVDNFDRGVVSEDQLCFTLSGAATVNVNTNNKIVHDADNIHIVTVGTPSSGTVDIKIS